jgi:hypothetical protein
VVFCYITIRPSRCIVHGSGGDINNLFVIQYFAS